MNVWKHRMSRRKMNVLKHRMSRAFKHARAKRNAARAARVLTNKKKARSKAKERMRKHHAKRLRKKFKKLKPKMIKYCEVKTKLVRAQGRCRGYRRFCHLYKKFGLHGAAKRHCHKMRVTHHLLLKHRKKRHHFRIKTVKVDGKFRKRIEE